VIALAAAVARVTPAPGSTPAFGSSAWFWLVLCILAVIAIFVGVLAAGAWQRKRSRPIGLPGGPR
jgi:hypothetical protein